MEASKWSGSSALKARAESSTISEKPEDENLGPSSSLPVPHYTGRLSYQKYVSSKVWTDLSFAQDTLKTARELDLAGTLPQQEKEEDQSKYMNVLDRGEELWLGLQIKLPKKHA